MTYETSITRAMAPPQALASPPSPCVRNCCLDEGDVCLGCGRHIDEILAWHGADAAQRSAILATAQARVDARLRRRRG
jgi:hypothetical protein